MHAHPTIAISFAGVLLLTAVVVSGAWVLSRVFARFHKGPRHTVRQHTVRARNGASDGVAKALGITAVLCALPLLLVIGYLTAAHSSTSREEKSGFQTAAYVQSAAAMPERPSVARPAHRRPAPSLPAELPTSPTPAGPQIDVTNNDATEIALKMPDGEVVMVSLPTDIVARFSADNRTRVLASFRENVPVQLRKAYALVPLSPTMAEPVAGGLRNVLTPGRMESLIRTAGEVWSKVVTESEARQRARVRELAEQEPLPAWLENSDHAGHGRFVVHTTFVPAGESPAELLRPMLNNALLERVVKTVDGTHALDAASLPQLLNIQLSDKAYKNSIRQTYTETQPIPTSTAGPVDMKRYFALVEFPPGVEQAALGQVRSAVQTNRTRALGITVGGVWLAVVLLSLALQASRSKSRWKRFAGTAISCLLMVPCAATALLMTLGMAEGKIPPIQQEPMTYVVDAN